MIKGKKKKLIFKEKKKDCVMSLKHPGLVCQEEIAHTPSHGHRFSPAVVKKKKKWMRCDTMGSCQFAIDFGNELHPSLFMNTILLHRVPVTFIQSAFPCKQCVTAASSNGFAAFFT